MMRRQTDNSVYMNRWDPADPTVSTVLDLSVNTDKVRRYRLTTVIRCRDLGLKS